jgi:hypothetical protein
MNTKNIDNYIRIGSKDINWYEDCQRVFEELFGKEKLELVCKLFAATSINTSLKSNIKLFRKALYEIQNDLPVGNYLPNIKKQLWQIRCGQELTGRKIRAFEKAMSGDINAVVVDTWLLRAFEVDRVYFRQTKGKPEGVGKNRSAGANEKDFKRIERWVRRYAKRNKLEPRQVGAMIWSGVRIATSGDTNTHYKEILCNTMNNLFGVI